MKCKECNGDIIRDGDDMVCEVCGILVADCQENLVTQHSRAFGDAEWKKRTSHEGRTSYSIIGKGLGGNGEIPHLHVHGVANKRDLEYKEAAMGKTLAQMRSLCERLHLPESVKEEAGRLLRQLKTFKGRSTDDIIIAIVFSAAKLNHCPRSMYRIMTTLGTTSQLKTVRKTLKWCRRELNIPLVVNGAEEYVSQIAADLNSIEECVQVGAMAVAKKVQGVITGHNPIVTAAAAILIAMGIRHPYDYAEVEEIAKAGGVSVTAIITRSKELRKM